MLPKNLSVRERLNIDIVVSFLSDAPYVIYIYGDILYIQIVLN